MPGKLIFSFDIPKDKASFRVKVWRRLKKMGAKQELGSFWILKYSKNNVTDLKILSGEIVRNGGKVNLIEGRIIWS